MKTVLLTCLAAAVAAGALAAARPAPLPVHSSVPDRPYHVLGPVAAVVEARAPGESAAAAVLPALAADARGQHGRSVDAILVTGNDLMPNGVTLSARGLALAWD